MNDLRAAAQKAINAYRIWAKGPQRFPDVEWLDSMSELEAALAAASGAAGQALPAKCFNCEAQEGLRRVSLCANCFDEVTAETPAAPASEPTLGHLPNELEPMPLPRVSVSAEQPVTQEQFERDWDAAHPNEAASEPTGEQGNLKGKLPTAQQLGAEPFDD